MGHFLLVDDPLTPTPSSSYFISFSQSLIQGRILVLISQLIIGRQLVDNW
jgi:hypothetical protein